MRHIGGQHCLLFLLCAALLAVGAQAQQAASLPDSTLFTTYELNSTATQFFWSTCGSTQKTEGCYGSGALGPFNQACAILVSSPTLIGPITVLRYIYVLDTGTSSNSVALVVFKRTDTVTASYDTGVVTQLAKLPLPTQTGGTGSACSMAANSGYIFLGTNQSSTAVRVSKADLSTAQIGGFSPPINVSAITADAYGYVAVTFGGGHGAESGFYLYGPDGQPQEDGGGAPFLLNTVNSVLASTVPQGRPVSQPLIYRSKLAGTNQER